jgi:hypothetical protein
MSTLITPHSSPPKTTTRAYASTTTNNTNQPQHSRTRAIDNNARRVVRTRSAPRRASHLLCRQPHRPRNPSSSKRLHTLPHPKGQHGSRGTWRMSSPDPVRSVRHNPLPRRMGNSEPSHLHPRQARTSKGETGLAPPTVSCCLSAGRKGEATPAAGTPTNCRLTPATATSRPQRPPGPSPPEPYSATRVVPRNRIVQQESLPATV